jgi:hypothetical protein
VISYLGRYGAFDSHDDAFLADDPFFLKKKRKAVDLDHKVFRTSNKQTSFRSRSKN